MDLDYLLVKATQWIVSSKEILGFKINNVGMSIGIFVVAFIILMMLNLDDNEESFKFELGASTFITVVAMALFSFF